LCVAKCHRGPRSRTDNLARAGIML
jgi:hypothetical protein